MMVRYALLNGVIDNVALLHAWVPTFPSRFPRMIRMTTPFHPIFAHRLLSSASFYLDPALVSAIPEHGPEECLSFR